MTDDNTDDSQNPFYTIEFVEKLINESVVLDAEESDYIWLSMLLTYERQLDRERIVIFETYGHDDPITKEFRFRELMIRHNISKIALQMNKKVTKRITGETDEQKSFLAGCIRERKEYPEPVKK